MAELAPPAAAVPAHFPRELSAHWPAAWRPNPGSRRGPVAWLEYAAVRAVLAATSRLPDAARAGLVDALAALGQRVDRRHANAAREWIAQALGPGLDERELDRRVRDAFRQFLRVTIESHRATCRIEPRRLREHMEIVKTPDVDRVLAQRRGALIAGAHFGDFETAMTVLPWIGFDPIYAVSRPPRNRYLALFAQRTRERRGARILPRNGAMQEIPSILAAGGFVVMLLDQRARHRPLLVPFFGREAACERAPSVLARRSRCPIVMCTGTFGERPLTWRVELGPVLWPEDARRMTPEQIATWINVELERRILAHPEQQLWVHDRYRARRPKARELGADAAAAEDD